MEVSFLKDVNSNFIYENIDKRFWECKTVEDLMLLQFEKKSMHPFNRTLLEYVTSNHYKNRFHYEYDLIKYKLNLPPYNGTMTQEQSVELMKKEMEFFNNNTNSLTGLRFESSEFKDLSSEMFTILTDRILRNKFNSEEKDLDSIYFHSRFDANKFFIVKNDPEELNRRISEFQLIHYTYYNDRKNLCNLTTTVSWNNLMHLSSPLTESGLPKLALDVINFLKDLCFDKQGLDVENSDVHTLLYPTSRGVDGNRCKISSVWPEYITYYQLGDIKNVNSTLERMLTYFEPDKLSSLFQNSIIEAALYLYRTKPSNKLKDKIKSMFDITFSTPAHEHYEAVQERIQTLFLIYKLFSDKNI